MPARPRVGTRALALVPLRPVSYLSALTQRRPGPRAVLRAVRAL